jgi:hypothetical protein
LCSTPSHIITSGAPSFGGTKIAGLPFWGVPDGVVLGVVAVTIAISVLITIFAVAVVVALSVIIIALLTLKSLKLPDFLCYFLKLAFVVRPTVCVHQSVVLVFLSHVSLILDDPAK